MWIFFTLVGLGLAFMLYAFIQFDVELKEYGFMHHRASHAKPEIVGERRVVQIISKQSVRNDSGKIVATRWSHSDGKIRARSIVRSGDVFVRGIRASAKPKLDTSGPSGSSKVG